MAKFEATENRTFKNIYICMKCTAKNRSATGMPGKCRKCGSKKFRVKSKKVKKA